VYSPEGAGEIHCGHLRHPGRVPLPRFEGDAIRWVGWGWSLSRHPGAPPFSAELSEERVEGFRHGSHTCPGVHSDSGGHKERSRAGA